jgi:hypothetical protein
MSATTDIFSALNAEYAATAATVAQRAIPYVQRDNMSLWDTACRPCVWAGLREGEGVAARNAARSASFVAAPLDNYLEI